MGKQFQTLYCLYSEETDQIRNLSVAAITEPEENTFKIYIRVDLAVTDPCLSSLDMFCIRSLSPPPK